MEIFKGLLISQPEQPSIETSGVISYPALKAQPILFLVGGSGRSPDRPPAVPRSPPALPKGTPPGQKKVFVLCTHDILAQPLFILCLSSGMFSLLPIGSLQDLKAQATGRLPGGET